MITTKENGTVYTSGLTKEVIDFHSQNGLKIADVNRPLTYEEVEEQGKIKQFKKYIDDITPVE